MPKLKSHGGAKKRLFRTGGGRVGYKRRGRNHLLQQKSKRQKSLQRTLIAHPVNERMLTSLAPYV